MNIAHVAVHYVCPCVKFFYATQYSACATLYLSQDTYKGFKITEVIPVQDCHGANQGQKWNILHKVSRPSIVAYCFVQKCTSREQVTMQSGKESNQSVYQYCDM